MAQIFSLGGLLEFWLYLNTHYAWLTVIRRFSSPNVVRIFMRGGSVFLIRAVGS